MAYGQNIKGKQPRAHFQEAGGSIIKFRHPYLAGQLVKGMPNIDEVDVSSCLKLNETYFTAVPTQDSAQQVVLIDGSTVTITNRLLNGVLNLPVIPTTGLVSTGDFVACLQLIKSVGDSIGGVLTLQESINGKTITTMYYGVTVKNVPDKIKMGMDVPVYNCQLVYAGWIQAVSASADNNKKAIWASGGKTGVEAYFTPYTVNNADGDGGTGTAQITGATNGEDVGWADDTNTANATDWTANQSTKDYGNAENATVLTE
jgi:hypothetical protein